MNHYPILMTLDGQAGYQTWQMEYHLGEQVDQDRLTLSQSVAERASANGWLRGLKPVVQDQGQIDPQSDCQVLCKGHGGRISVDGRYQWRLQPQTGWPAPFRLLERDGHTARESLIWEKPGWEILDLQLDPLGEGLYFAVQNPSRQHQLLFWSPKQRRIQKILAQADFVPIEFTVAPDGNSILFVHQVDDQLYRLDRVSGQLHQLSIPQLEFESQQGHRVYRTSPAFSPDGKRVFYCTTYLELCDLELAHWGNLYVLPERGGRLVRLEIDSPEEACPVNFITPTAALWSAAPLALAC